MNSDKNTSPICYINLNQPVELVENEKEREKILFYTLMDGWDMVEPDNDAVDDDYNVSITMNLKRFGIFSPNKRPFNKNSADNCGLYGNVTSETCKVLLSIVFLDGRSRHHG